MTKFQCQFLALGDWGNSSDVNGKRRRRQMVANEMIKISKRSSSFSDNFFVVALGDNFYPDGVMDENDTQWKTDWSDVFDGMNCRWHPVLGNHDWHQNPLAQVNYKKDPRWQMDGLYYSKVLGNIHFIYLDTTTLCPELSTGFIGGRKSKLYPPKTVHFKAAEKYEQFRWLENTLSESKSEWIIVFGHYPIHSGGKHDPKINSTAANGNDEMKTVSDLLKRYNVDAYFCGHDHTLQYIYDPEKTQIHCFISGCGTYSSTCSRIPDMKRHVFFEKTTGFLNVTVSGSRMTVRMINNSGVMLGSYSFRSQPKININSQIVRMIRNVQLKPETHTLHMDPSNLIIEFYDRKGSGLLDLFAADTVAKVVASGGKIEVIRSTGFRTVFISNGEGSGHTHTKVVVEKRTIKMTASLVNELFSLSKLSCDEDGYLTYTATDGVLFTEAPAIDSGNVIVVRAMSDSQGPAATIAVSTDADRAIVADTTAPIATTAAITAAIAATAAAVVDTSNALFSPTTVDSKSPSPDLPATPPIIRLAVPQSAGLLADSSAKLASTAADIPSAEFVLSSPVQSCNDSTNETVPAVPKQITQIKSSMNYKSALMRLI